jgi:hypothetical protein
MTGAGGQDDLLLFPFGAPVQLPTDLPPLPKNVFSEFGFKLITLSEDDTTDVDVWTAATEDDYRRFDELLGLEPEQHDAALAGRHCHLYNGMCTGGCAGDRRCGGAQFSQQLRMVRCRCR